MRKKLSCTEKEEKNLKTFWTIVRHQKWTEITTFQWHIVIVWKRAFIAHVGAGQDHIDEEFGFLNACERRRKSRHFKRHSDSASRHSKTTNNGRSCFFSQFFSVFVESFLSFDCLLCHQSFLSSSLDLTYIPYSVFGRNLNFSQHNSPPTRFWLQLISISLYCLDWQSSTSNCAVLTMWHNRNEIDLNDFYFL